MAYAAQLRRMFPELEPTVDDLFLLEAHQIAQLPDRAPTGVLAAVLRAEPRLRRYLITRHPPIEAWLDELGRQVDRAADPRVAADELVWELADLIVYQRAPELYAGLRVHDWDFAAVTESVELSGRTVIDAGAGSGQVALQAAPFAAVVFAVEPASGLRTYLRQEAAARGFTNVFTIDGTLDAIPLPDDTADVLLTCRAVGWSLAAELAEIDRVVGPGGVALHLAGPPEGPEGGDPLHEGLLTGGYVGDECGEGRNRHRRYRRVVADHRPAADVT